MRAGLALTDVPLLIVSVPVLVSQPIDCATKQTKKWLTDGAHRGGTEDKRIDLPRLEGREGQGLLSCLQWKGRERTED